MVTLVSPGIRISIAGALAIIAGLLIWAFKGAIPSSSDSSGIYMQQSAYAGQYAQKAGILSYYSVRAGDSVNAGDVVATLADEDEYFKLQQMDMRISYVENITFDSDFDVVTSDTEPLAAIKLKLAKVGDEAYASEASLALKSGRLSELASTVNARKRDVLNYKEKYYKSLSTAEKDRELSYTEAESDYEAHSSLYEQAKNTYIGAVESYVASKKEFDERYKHYDPETATVDEIAAYDAAYGSLQAAANQAEDYKLLMEAEGVKLQAAEIALKAARKAYLEYLNEQSGIQADNTIAYTEYTEALSAYNTALNEYHTLRSQIDDLEVQSAVNSTAAENDETTLRQEFSNQKASILSNLNNQRDEILNLLDRGNLSASESGVVYHLDLTPGMQVTAGQQLLSVIPFDREEDTVVCYVPLSIARKLTVGMEAHIFPTSVNKHEYGYIEGTVQSVSDFVETLESMRKTLDNNDKLIEEFLKKGSVAEVRCSLVSDPETVSGYRWSSKKGGDVAISTNTLVNVTFITGEKRPIDIFIPYIKEKLEFKPKEKNG